MPHASFAFVYPLLLMRWIIREQMIVDRILMATLKLRVARDEIETAAAAATKAMEALTRQLEQWAKEEEQAFEAIVDDFEKD
jgi:hypothetical protein